MYKWYQNAEICYVYLADFSLQPYQPTTGIHFTRSRWFTRGWTLQELLAPEHVVFYDRDWIELGSRSFLEHEIGEATRISPEHMRQPRSASVATKMSWASTRQTSREEDMAYSLLGLFDINMPLIYGEGMKAFFRLQSEIIRTTSDESIYAWSDRDLLWSGLLARSPAAFRDSGDIVPVEELNSLPRSPPYMTNRGIAIEILESRTMLQSMDHSHFTLTVPLSCAKASQKNLPLKLQLRPRGQVASRIESWKIEFYEAEIPEDKITSKRVLFYVENIHAELKATVLKTNSFTPVGVTLTPAAKGQLVFSKHLHVATNGLVRFLDVDVVPRSRVFLSDQEKIWFRFHDGFEFLLTLRYVAKSRIPDIRIYSSNSTRGSPLFVQSWKNSRPMNIFRQLPSPTSILSEPYDSTTLPLSNAEFLWIKTELGQDGRSRFYNVHIDITSIDRSRLLLKTHSMEESE